MLARQVSVNSFLQSCAEPPLSEVSDRPPAINGSRLLQLTGNNDPGQNIQPGFHRERLQSVVQLASALEKGGKVGFEEGLSMQVCLESRQTWEEACWDRKDRRDRMDRKGRRLHVALKWGVYRQARVASG